METTRSQRCRVSRDNLLDVLWAENVLARRYFYPGSHRMEPYHYDFPDAHRRLPNTDRLSRSVLALPTGTAVGPDEIRGEVGAVRGALRTLSPVRSGEPRHYPYTGSGSV